MGPRLGRPAQQRHAGAAAHARVRRSHRAPLATPAAAGPARRLVPRTAAAELAPARRRSPAGGRCCPSLEADPTRRAHAAAEALLERHGVVTRGAVARSGCPAGSPASTRCSSAFEDSGRCRRGYFVAGLGAAQFGAPGAVDRLRSFSHDLAPRDAARGPCGHRPRRRRPGPRVVALAATDPANPYGAALPWPERLPRRRGGERRAPGTDPDARPARWSCSSTATWCSTSSAAGRTLLTFTDDVEVLTAAATELAAAVRRGALGRLTVERADGEHILGSAGPAARRRSRRRLRGHAAGAEAAWLTRGGVPEGDTVWRTARTPRPRRSPADADPDRLPGPGASPRSTCRRPVVGARWRAASTCSPGSATTTRCTPT